MSDVSDGALVWRGDEILWAGPASRVPGAHGGEDVFDAGGRLVIPGLIDCHTHLAFGGWRSAEFADRIRGRSYLEIAAAGGGIASTVRATRRMDDGALRARARDFADEMLAAGVCTVECKSGYGLRLDTELALLRAYRALADEGPQRIVSTFLGAHVVPPEYRDDREAYVTLVVEEMIPAVAGEGLAEFCDVFVEEGAFSADEARRVLGAAADHGMRAKLHVDQLEGGGGAELAAELGAVSADHLEFASPAGIAAMAEAGVVGVTLPIATLVLNQDPPPAREMIDAGVAVAVATDFNPGTAPSHDLRLALMLACNRQRMTPAEALKGATRYAARAIGRESDLGSLEPGKAADFVVLDSPDLDHWMYHYRPEPSVATVVGGTVCAGELTAADG
ncbi:MAG: imidazolonepropionase [Gemmatimonadota bacterium]